MWMKRNTFMRIVVLLLFASIATSACRQEAQTSKVQKLADWLSDKGYHCSYVLLAETEIILDVPIENENDWYLFRIGEENLFVYFDTSNRAKQLVEQFFSKSAAGHTVAFTLRFIVHYLGEDIGILSLMNDMGKQ